MTASDRNQFIETHCGVRYAGNVCEYYERFSQECALLKTQGGQDFWENCREAFKVFYEAVNHRNEMMRKQYDALPVTDAEDVPFDDMIRRLATQRMNIANLAAWRKYVEKMAYREIRKTLVKQGLLFRKKQCGNCVHLTSVKPLICAEKGIGRKQTDEPCGYYQANLGRFESLDADDRSDDSKKRERIEKLRSEMQKAASEHAQATEETSGFRAEAERLLRERAEEEPLGSVRRKICCRQYDVFVNILALLAEGIPKERVEQELAKKHRLKDARTIRRDLDEIRAFLRENVRDSS